MINIRTETALTFIRKLRTLKGLKADLMPANDRGKMIVKFEMTSTLGMKSNRRWRPIAVMPVEDVAPS